MGLTHKGSWRAQPRLKDFLSHVTAVLLLGTNIQLLVAVEPAEKGAQVVSVSEVESRLVCCTLYSSFLIFYYFYMMDQTFNGQLIFEFVDETKRLFFRVLL